MKVWSLEVLHSSWETELQLDCRQYRADPKNSHVRVRKSFRTSGQLESDFAATSSLVLRIHAPSQDLGAKFEFVESSLDAKALT